MAMIEKSVLAHDGAMQDVANSIWLYTQQWGQTPVVLTSTSGPITELRRLLEFSRPALLNPAIAFLPKILSVSDWLSKTPSLVHFPPVLTTLQRWEMVYGELAKHKKIQSQFGVIGEGGRWAMAKAIVQACDFLTQANISFAPEKSKAMDVTYEQVQAEFEETIKKAYPHNLELAHEEGQLIFAFWKYLSSTEDPFVRERMAYQYRQKELENSDPPPLVWLEMAPPSKTLQTIQAEFLKAYAQKQEVLKMDIDWEQSALWPECISGKTTHFEAQILEQVKNNRQKFQKYPWRIISQPNFEKLAWASLACIQEHIQADRKNIAIVAQDRLVARRVRALLARYGDSISIKDPTGWKLATTSAAAAVHSYLQLMSSNEGPSLATLFGFLKNPMLNWQAFLASFTANKEIDSQDFSWWMESRLLASQVGMGWQELQSVFAQEIRQDEHPLSLEYRQIAQALLTQLQSFSVLWQSLRNTSKEWVDLLKGQLDSFGMMNTLAEDEAGESFLNMLDELQELHLEVLKSPAWTSLLDQWIDQASYTQKAQRKSINISFVPLSAIRFHHYQAVVFIGCDARQLPSTKDYGSVFSRAMLKELDEALPESEFIQQARDLSQLLTSHEHVDLLWQEYQQAQEKNRLCGWLARLQMDMPDLTKPIVLNDAAVDSQPQTQSSTPILDLGLLPNKLSPSAYKALRSCPYQFYVTYVLGLKSPKALQEQSDFGQIGSLLHAIMHQFYQDYQQQTFADDLTKHQWMIDRLENISKEQWSILIAQNGQLFADQHKWFKQIESLVDWQIELEKNGWTFAESEKTVEFALQLTSGDLITIFGRVDRVDIKDNSDLKVLDYKFKDGDQLKKSNEQLFDDPQILIYSQALTEIHQHRHREVKQAGWVSLREAKEEQRDLEIKVTPETLKQIEEQIREDLNQIWAGVPMPANGPQQVCKYCDARGICRKGMWEA
jgi:ATP-dependent helicase/nuclease subunit B